MSNEEKRSTHNIPFKLRKAFGVLRHARENAELVGRLQDELSELAQSHRTDKLTGVLNRHGLDEVIKDLVQDALLEEHIGRKACVLALDLDGFKPINDLYDHDAGDQLLCQVFSELGKLKVSSGQLHFARTGGDEGVAIFYNMVPEGPRPMNPNHPAERRGRTMSFEEYAIDVVHEQIQEIASKKFKIVLHDKTQRLVSVGISDGYATVVEVTRDGMEEGLRLADLQSQARKYGLDEFLEIVEREPVVEEFAKKLLGFELDLTTEGGYYIDREMGVSALVRDPRFTEFNALLSERARKWLFPEMAPQRSQGPRPLGR